MLKHFTATAYIVSKINGKFKVLLHKHKKLNIWIGIGGHIEKDENPIEALFREIREETNLAVEPIKNDGRLVKTKSVTQLITPDVLFEEKVPKYGKKSAHLHIDHMYFVFCKNPGSIKMSEEFRWYSSSELDKLNLKKEVEVFARKALEVVA